MEVKKYQYIDSLRGIAILLVILSHIGLISHVMHFFDSSVIKFIYRGIHGVQLFFIVSAFTLTKSYYARKDELHKNRNFFIRRFFRIAPMYYLAILYFTFADFMHFDIHNFSNIPLKGIISSFLFANGFFPAWINTYVPGGWTITVEFMFYAILPFILIFINDINKSLMFVLGSLLFSTILNEVLADSSFDKFDFLYYYFPNQVPVFALGILAYWVTENNVKDIKPVSLLFLVMTIFIYCYTSLPFHFLYSIIFFFILVILTKKNYSLLSNKFLAIIGRYSFSLYLVHFAILGFFARNDIHTIINASGKLSASFDILIYYSIVFFLSLFVSFFTYNYIEVPGQNLGRELIKRLK